MAQENKAKEFIKLLTKNKQIQNTINAYIIKSIIQSKKQTSIHNGQQSSEKQDFNETFKKILNSDSFKEECQKLLTKKIC